jgi:VWFA-related protein
LRPVSTGRSCIVARKRHAHSRAKPTRSAIVTVPEELPLKRLILAAALFAATAVPAQQPKPQPPPQPQSNEMPKISESIDVRVINVDVVVNDKKGNPVTGLTKDDFEIYENNFLKPISNFYEVDNTKGVPTAPVVVDANPTPALPKPVRVDEVPENQKRRIIFYIDNLSLAPFNRNRVFKQMKEFVPTIMRPGDEAMVATFNRSMKVRVPFTRDPVQIQTTLDIIAGESAMGTSNRSERKQTEDNINDARSYDEALATARTYSESIEHDLRQSQESLTGLMTTLAGVEGKKALVLTSEGFPMQPGREMFAYLDEKAKEKGWRDTGTILEGMSFDSHEIIRDIARTANANGITMYTIHAAGLSGDNDNSAENARPTSFNVSQTAIMNTTDSMQLMAEMTGGVASIQTNNFGAAFQKIKRDLDSYYSLGYRGGTERVDRTRSLVVKAKNRAYTVRARQTFVEKSTYTEMNDRVIANLLYKTKANELNILLKMNQPIPTDDEDLVRVPVEVQIPMDLLTFLPQGEADFVGGFDVYVVVANKDGDMSDVARKTHQIHVTREDMPKSKGKYYTYTLDLLMEKGLNKVSVGVVDDVSSVSGFAAQQVLAKDLR